MKQYLSTLEKSKPFWFLLITSAIFFLLRLPSLIEPYWYGDEGIYEILGAAMRHGRLLYRDIYDNKPPLLYVVYSFFNGDQFGVRLFSLLVGLITVWVFFLLIRKLTRNDIVSYSATVVFAFFFSIPYMEANIANAENFMLLPIITAGLLITSVWDKKLAENKRLSTHLLPFVAGCLLGIAFLFKIVAVFDFAAFFLFLFLINLPDRFSNIFQSKTLLHTILKPLHLLFGFVTPILLTLLFFLTQGALRIFFQAAFSQNVGYVGYGNAFFIPQGLLILKLFLLFIAVLVIFLKRRSLSKPVLFSLLWFAFSVFNAFFSQRPYTHYVLVALPSGCLLLAVILMQKKYRLLLLVLFLSLVIMLMRQFHYFGWKRSYLYYGNFLAFVFNQKSVYDYERFFDRNVPRDNHIAEYIKARVPQNSTIFLFGNSAQIYKLSDTFPPGRYTVAYHMTASKQTMTETESALQRTKPLFIVIMPDEKSQPFSLLGYTYQATIDNTDIYKRNDYEENKQ